MVAKARPAVVRIETSQADGSGFIFQIGYPIPGEGRTALVLTNYHVIEGANKVNVTVNDSNALEGIVLGVDASNDLAVLKICCGQFQALEFGDAGGLREGTGVAAMGYPLGISGRASVTDGIVSALRNESGQWVIQTDAAINPGNSGGPLLSRSGEVLGISTYRYEYSESGRPVEGMGFAVSQVTIEHQLPALKSGHLLPTPTPRTTPTPTPLSYYEEGVRLNDLGLYAEAIAQFTQAIRLDPTDPFSYWWRGTSYYDLGQYQQAIQDFDQAIQLDPTFASSYSMRALSYYDLGLYQQAIQGYEQAIRLDPTSLRYRGRGISYYHLGQYQRAIQDLDQAIQLDPTDTASYGWRGSAYRQLGQYQRAIHDFDQAIQLDPTDAANYTWRGSIYYDLGQYQRAIQDLDQAIQLDPTDAASYAWRGNADYELGLYGQGDTDWDTACRLDIQNC